jgi:ribonuclease HIII
VELILEHNAERYSLVAAASIIAKVTGDREIEKIKKEIKIDFGSGYMSDPKTVEFLKNNFENYPEMFRKSWFPYKELVNKKFQKRLSDFTQFLKEEKKHHGHTLDDLKKLEDFGFHFEKPKTEHELTVMKGSCTVILYKNGKLILQGDEEAKKDVSKLLGISI